MPTRPPVHQAGAASADYAKSRGHFRQQGYSARWDRVSLQHRKQNPLCVGCLAVGDTRLAYCADHIIPHKGDPVLMWDTSNLQSACKWHHDMIKQQLEGMHARGEIDASQLRLDSTTAKKLTLRLR